MSKIKKISIVLLLLLFIPIYEQIDNHTHRYIIDNIYLNDNVSNKVNYIGYIEIKKLNIKREIVLGINNYNLLNHVALSSYSKNLESNNIILAGHAIKNIFGNLKNIKVDDEIIINTNQKNNYYKVYNVDIVSKYDTNVIDNSDLILITCINLNKRLIVKAKRI